MTRYVYSFGEDIGDAVPKELLGGKGAGLAEMTRLGVPVPPGFTITTAACAEHVHRRVLWDELREEIAGALARLEGDLDKKLGDPASPLLVSVRSGARASMPGMMDTILNLGLNDQTVEALAEGSQDRRFAFDAYRRLIEMYGDVVLGVDRERFEHVLTATKTSLGDPSMLDHEVPVDALEKVVEQFKDVVSEHAGQPFPQDVWDQLWGAIGAVFESWDNPRAKRYRRMQDIPDDWGTAVNVQAMVFGNMGNDSGSGVCFTRNPSTGEKTLYGEFLPNAQGEDVVAGIRTPRALAVRAARPGAEDETLERTMPAAFTELRDFAVRLEGHFHDLQDIEFTIEKKRVFILQTRNGKRAAHAAVKIAVDMVDEGLLDERGALRRVEPQALEQLLHARLPDADTLAAQGIHPIATGLPASPGAAMGAIVFDADEAEELAARGKAVILVRRETSPEDIHGMKAAEGIVTATGGMTSHAAVVARGLGKPCVAGVGALSVDYEAQKVTVRQETEAIVLGPGDRITLDGTGGCIYQGELDVVAAAKVEELDTLMEWADRERRLDVRANADTPRDARRARTYGAQGIGLCRTEHMFFAEERLDAVRCMALAEPSDRQPWLDRLAPMQKEDFVEIFRAMDGLPVTIRLLDWPLHEFMPREDWEFEHVAKSLEVTTEEVRNRARNLAEVNPMLGHRGVRVGITAPEIYQMQVQAIAEAAQQVVGEGVEVHPEIMIPVVGIAAELARATAAVRETMDSVVGTSIVYHVGTMIELPRACLVAGELAKYAEFFSFGTNDLTQTTFGISRDDAGHFMSAYLGQTPRILDADPFARLDEAGVGELIQIAVDRGRAARAEISLGICGEHGGDPRSIRFAHRVGLDYVSCSPPRLPVARLAAAQAALDE